MTGPLLRRSKRPAFTGALLDWWRSCRRPPLFAWLTVFSFSRRRIRWPPERVRARASDPARAADGGRASRSRARLRLALRRAYLRGRAGLESAQEYVLRTWLGAGSRLDRRSDAHHAVSVNSRPLREMAGS